MKKSGKFSPEKFDEVLKGIQRSHDFIREITGEMLAGSQVITKNLSGYSAAERSVIYIILESISETPIRFTGDRKGMVLVFREWSMSKSELIIKTNNLAPILNLPGSDLGQWFESFL